MKSPSISLRNIPINCTHIDLGDMLELVSYQIASNKFIIRHDSDIGGVVLTRTVKSKSNSNSILARRRRQSRLMFSSYLSN
jgi:hypothetical protein